MATKSAIIGGITPVTPWSRHRPAPDNLYHLFLPRRVVLPINQTIGKPLCIIVRKGQRLAIGQTLAEPEDDTAVPIHASISGEVDDINEVELADGRVMPAVRIAGDGGSDRIMPFSDEVDPENPACIIQRVREAGIVGMGGAAFPTHIKLQTKGKKIDFLLINGAECEPLIQADDILMRVDAAKICRGALLAANAVDADTVLVGIESNKPEAIAAMRQAGGENGIEVIPMPHHYPMGGEKQLLRYMTGRDVPEDGLPADAGAVILNVATAAAIADAVERHLPSIRRLATVTGDVGHPRTIMFPVGSLIQDVLEFCGGITGPVSKVIHGGPMMGQAVRHLDVPMLKNANGLMVFAQKNECADVPAYPCIRCNRCVAACPMRLMPWRLDEYYQKGRLDDCKRFRADKCINCGCCTYVCPSKIPLAYNITQSSKMIKQKAKESGNG